MISLTLNNNKNFDPRLEYEITLKFVTNIYPNKLTKCKI